MSALRGYKSISWKHSQVKLNDREDENVSEEFFNDVETLDVVSSLVRESVQNSNDEVLDKSLPVKVRFKVGRQKALLNKEYFSDIYSHAQESLPKNLIPDLNQDAKYLVIEDFNTGGLRGSISSIRPTDESKKKYGSNFWFFEWKTGETNKLAGSRGSWGIGKAVLSAASKLKTILVYSERDKSMCQESETESILFGHSIFKYAFVNGIRLKPHRNWMKEVEVNGEIEFRPSSDQNEIDLFCSDWQIQRQKAELGTSILIPYIKDDISAEHLAKCVIHDYFIAILDNTVVCVIEDENEKKLEISRENLLAYVESMDEHDLASFSKSKSELIGFCQMYQNRINNKTIKKEIRASLVNSNDWTSIIFEQEMKEQFYAEIEQGKTIEFIVNTDVPTDKKDVTRADKFSVLFSKFSKDGLSRTLFTRRGMIIPEAFRESKINGILSMVIVEEGDRNELHEMLKLAEGPAHKNWSDKGDKVQEKYEKKGLTKTINWVKTSAISIFRRLQPDQNMADDRSLARYFPNEMPNEGVVGDSENESERATGKPEGGKGGSGGKGSPRGGRLLRVEGGSELGTIVVTPIDSTRIEKNMSFELEFAYSLRAGDSFSAWDLEDFEIDKLLNESETFGARVTVKGNKAILTIDKPTFSVTFSNFDPIRDVSVDAKRIK